MDKEKTYKNYREEFLPTKISYLLIGESPPFVETGKKLRYFYNYDNNDGGHILLSSVSYAFLNKKFSKMDNKKKVLEELSRKGVFLLDGTYSTINHIKSKKERQRKIFEDYPNLINEIRKRNLSQDTKIFLLHSNVIESISTKLRNDLKYEIIDVGFPRYYYDEKFTKIINGALKNE